MPSSYTPSLRIELQFTGENLNLWGEKLNSGLSLLDHAIAGWMSIAITGDYAPTSINGQADEACAAMLKFTGTLAANATITIPAVPKNYFIYNATNKVLTFTTGAGATIGIDAGDKQPIFCDGSAVHQITYGNLGLKNYITSITASAGAVPGTTGHLGKFLKVTADGGPSTWQQIQSTDIGDFEAEVRRMTLVYTLIFGGA